MIAERRLALIMTDEGSLTIVRQLEGAPLVIGDYVSGLALELGNCVLRNETSRERIAVAVDVLGVTPAMVPSALSTA